MKRLTTVVLATAVMAMMTGQADAQIKNVLLEQHTGAWCGWCPNGTVTMDEILDLYGDQVIGVKIHTGDAMEIPEQSVLADVLELRGVPSASVDRKRFGGEAFLSPGAWKSACEFQMRQRAKAEVDCFYTLDKRRRAVRIHVVANITESMDLPVRFNAYIVEDDVTGVGSGYDQANYLSGRSGFEGHPYYEQPSKMYGYHHMKVVRKMLGGPWGVPGEIPAAVEAGELYSHEFVANLDGGWNIDNLHVVGILQADADDNKEIINSAVAIEDGSLLNRIVDSNVPAAQVVPAGSDLINAYTLMNLTDVEQAYTVTLSTTERTPADWVAEFTDGVMALAASGTDAATGQIVVPANSIADLSLTLKVGSTPGGGDAEVVFELDGTPTITRSRIVSAITSEIEVLLLETESDYSMRPYLSDTPCADIPVLAPGDYLAFADELTNIKLVIWNKGPSDGLSAEEVEITKGATGVNTFICGDGVIGGLGRSGDLSYFGLEWIGWNLESFQPNGTIWVSGQAGDVITGDLGGGIEGRLMNYYINMVRIVDPAHVFPIMHFQGPGIRRLPNGATHFVSADDAIFGVRSTRNGVRTVLLGMCPYVFADEAIRHELVGSILDWLGEGLSLGGPDE